MFDELVQWQLCGHLGPIMISAGHSTPRPSQRLRMKVSSGLIIPQHSLAAIIKRENRVRQLKHHRTGRQAGFQLTNEKLILVEQSSAVWLHRALNDRYLIKGSEY